MVMSRQTEILIIAFIAICIFLILFEIVHAFKMNNRDKRIKELQAKKNVVDDLLSNTKNLKNETNLLAFELCFDKEKEENGAQYSKHVETAKKVFAELIINREISDSIVKSYVVYLASKYLLFHETDNVKVKNELIYLVGDGDVYVRENALKCIYGIGDQDLVVQALLTIQNRNIRHNRKLLHDGLLEFAGDKKALSDLLVKRFEDFNLEMQITISTYLRFQSGDYCKEAFECLKDETKDKDLRISALRYLQKYPYNEALSYIIKMVSAENEHWEYRAIAASCLGSYQDASSYESLKKAMNDTVWYVRKNAAESLIKLNPKEQIDSILMGEDTYAKEQLQYKLDEQALIMEAKK